MSDPVVRLMAVDVARGPAFAFSNRRALFSMVPYNEDRQHQPYDLSPDDRRFLVVKSAGTANMEVVVNWWQSRSRADGGSQ